MYLLVNEHARCDFEYDDIHSERTDSQMSTKCKTDFRSTYIIIELYRQCVRTCENKREENLLTF
jgi:hypothetical protein